MSEITTALAQLTALFGTTMVLAVLVTGFWKGRDWFNSVDSGYGETQERDEWEEYKEFHGMDEDLDRDDVYNNNEWDEIRSERKQDGW